MCQCSAERRYAAAIDHRDPDPSRRHRFPVRALDRLAVHRCGYGDALRSPPARPAIGGRPADPSCNGDPAREIVAARFTRTLGTLLVNGVPLITAIAIVRDAVGNRAAVVALEQAGLAATAGAGLSRPLSASGVFPSRTVHLLHLGEETAQLGPMCLRAAEIHEERPEYGDATADFASRPGDHDPDGRGDRLDRLLAAASDAEPR